jgi:hypothetical protein
MYNTKDSRAYRLREFCGGGNGEPNDTLKASNAVSRQQCGQQEQFPTCFQRTAARSTKPLSRLRMRNKPASMMISRVTSVASEQAQKALRLIVLVITHLLAAGTHSARICRSIRQEGQRIGDDLLL